MKERICFIGLDEQEIEQFKGQVEGSILAHSTLPPIKVDAGKLFVQHDETAWLVPVSQVIYHGIFDNDQDLMAALALWGGPCLPNPHAMMDCRLKLPCLVRALQFTKFGSPLRGYVSPNSEFETTTERVAKWGNWHCGENKARFSDSWTSEEACIIEDFISGEAMRVILIGDQAWQIHLKGDDWLKSIHHPDAHFVEIDAELLADTKAIQAGFGLEIVANDYMVSESGTKHLLEVNHIPNVTQFPEIWEAYREFVLKWLKCQEKPKFW